MRDRLDLLPESRPKFRFGFLGRLGERSCCHVSSSNKYCESGGTGWKGIEELEVVKWEIFHNLKNTKPQKDNPLGGDFERNFQRHRIQDNLTHLSQRQNITIMRQKIKLNWENYHNEVNSKYMLI
jgi:hypothetical protein